MILKSQKHSTVKGKASGVGGGGEEGNSRLRTLQSRIPPPLFLTSPPLPFFSITKYCPLLRNFPHFSLFSCRSLLSQLPYSSPPPPPKKHTHTHTHTFHSWLFSLYLDFLPLRLLRLRNIEHYFVA